MSRVLGIEFFDGNVDEAVARMLTGQGFLIAPSGTCFARLPRDLEYRDAVSNADCALVDSGALALLWRAFRHQKLPRISGLRYLISLVEKLRKERVLWIVPNQSAQTRAEQWLRDHGFPGEIQKFYIAPFYTVPVADEELAQLIERENFRHVIVGIGSGPQEKLGYWLRQQLTGPCSIHCIGAALGFLTGDQVAIPLWADRVYLGWLFRLLSQPRKYLPRLWLAGKLPLLVFRNGENLPPLCPVWPRRTGAEGS